MTGTSVVYTPAAGEYGADAFTYRATDGTADSALATVDVTISRPPECQDIEETAVVGSSVSVPLTCADPDGDELTLAIASGPAQGSLGAISGESVTYTPHLDAVGEDTFTFTAEDDLSESAPATVTITLTGPPHCEDGSARTRVGTPVTVALECTDPDGDPLDLEIVDGPSQGSLGAISGGEVTYTPDDGEFGTDSFTFKAGDGSGESAPATVTLAPLARAELRGRRGQDGGRRAGLGAARLRGPGRRRADAERRERAGQGHARQLLATAVTYTPDADEYGEDSFTYTAADGAGDSEPATVSVTITRPPSCEPVDAETPARTPVTVELTCSDPDGDELTLHKASGAGNGTLGDIDGGQVTYTPDDDFSGEDSFTYRASDGTASSAPATVSVTVLPPPNEAPACEPVAAKTLAGHAVPVALDCSDPDGDAADALGRRRARARRARRRLGRQGHLHAGRRLPRRRLVHLPRV